MNLVNLVLLTNILSIKLTLSNEKDSIPKFSTIEKRYILIFRTNQSLHETLVLSQRKDPQRAILQA